MFRDFGKKDYIESLYQSEPEHIKKIRESCPEKLRKMQMSFPECKILSFFLKIINANKVLELGTLVGCSATWIADSLFGDNPIVITVEKSLKNYEIAMRNLSTNTRIKLVHADALEFLKSCPDVFDAIFIDAKKTEYKDYLKLAKSCLRDGGMLIIDNSLMIDYDTMPEISSAIHEFNTLIESDRDLTSVIIPTTSGFTVAIKNLKS
jgi:predicted O-methyltransferase YrrM